MNISNHDEVSRMLADILAAADKAEDQLAAAAAAAAAEAPDSSPESIPAPEETELSFSPEDEAWADSCLIAGADPPDDVWKSMQDALLDKLAAAGTDEMQEDTGEFAAEREGQEVRSESAVAAEGPRAEELLEGEGGGDSEEEIFKVWDLGIKYEEDDLIRQLTRDFAKTGI